MQKLSRLTDEQLVAAYVEGSNEAFDVLLTRHQNNVYSYIVKIVKNEEIADDIFQETFMKIITTVRQGRYVDSGRFAAWMMRIARNLIIDYFRQEKSNNTVSIDYGEVDLLNRKELSDGTVEDVMVTDQIHSDVRRLMEALPETQREVLEMRFFKDMSFKEIAETTNVSINTALGRMRYALMHIRKLAKEKNIALSI